MQLKHVHVFVLFVILNFISCHFLNNSFHFLLQSSPLGVSVDLDLTHVPPDEKDKIVEAMRQKLLRYTCVLCGREFQSNETLEMHFWDHTDDKYELACLICGEGFISKEALQSHVRAHTPSSPISPTSPVFKIRKFSLP